MRLKACSVNVFAGWKLFLPMAEAAFGALADATCLLVATKNYVRKSEKGHMTRYLGA